MNETIFAVVVQLNFGQWRSVRKSQTIGYSIMATHVLILPISYKWIFRTMHYNDAPDPLFTGSHILWFSTIPPNEEFLREIKFHRQSEAVKQSIEGYLKQL